MMSIYRFTGAIFAVFFISSCNMKAKATENDNASLKDEYSLMNAGGRLLLGSQIYQLSLKDWWEELLF